MRWLSRSHPGRAHRMAPVAEVMEPRILYSADLVAGLALGTGVAGVAEQRTLSVGGEYTATASTAVDVKSATSVAAAYATTALTFEANQGQAGRGVDYVASGSGYDIALAGGNAALTLASPAGQQTVQLELDGAKPDAVPEAQGMLEARSNYLLGSDASQWHTGIANYGSVTYHDVYDGVNVRYYGTQRQLEYDFIVAPGADASAVSLRFKGVESIQIDGNGDLVLQVQGTDAQVRFKAPVSYQQGEWGPEAVASRYELRPDGSVGFVLGSYDHSRELVIDPVLDYATYLGGAGTQSALGVTTDAAGNVYVTGRTTSSAPPFAAVIGGGGGSGDIFVAKFSADLSTLLYSTRIGGTTGDEQGNAIAVDGSGNVAVTGWTSSANFPTLAADQSAISGARDAVVFKLDASGALVFSTYFGGTGITDSGNAVAIDAAGNVYVAGEASSTGVASGLLGAALGTSDNAFINKYSSTGTAVYKDLFGGSAQDLATGLAVGAAGDVYVVGDTQSTNLPTVGGQQSALSGASDGFLAHLDAGGGNVLYSSYVGGKDVDTATAVAIDGSGMAYVVGQTRAKDGADFLTTSGALRTSSPDNNKDTGFLRIYDTTQSGAQSLVYSTYLSGSNVDAPTGVSVSNGRIGVVGQTTSSDFPITANAIQATNPGPGAAMFIAVINAAGMGAADLQFGTYYGSNMTTGGVAVTSTGVYATASTATPGLATAGAYSTAPTAQDALVVGFTFPAANSAPVLAGVNQPAAMLEDSGGGTGMLVSALVAGQITDADAGALQGIAVIAASTPNGTWQYSLDGGGAWSAIGARSATSALLLAADAQTRIRFVPSANFAGTVSAALTFRAWDRTVGNVGGRANTTINGGMSSFSVASASVDVVVTPVNDAPVRTAGVVSNLAVLEDAPITSLGLGTLAYGPGGGADEAVQTLSYTVTTVPAATLGTVVLADGTTTVAANTAYSLTDLQGMQFKAAANAIGGPVTFAWKVTDNGGTANGGVDTLAESLTISVTAVNDPPVRIAGVVNNLTLLEDAATTSLGLGALNYSSGGGPDEASQGLTFKVTAVPAATLGNVVLVDGTTVVTANTAYSLTDLQGMQFKAAANANGGPASFAWTVKDSGGTANGGVDTLAESLTIGVTAVNDAPVRTAGTVSDLLTTKTSPTTSLNLTGLTYGPGGGSDEAAQTLTYKVTVVPSAALGTVLLGDGVTVVTANTSYTLPQLQGMQFNPKPSGGGVGIFAWTVQDSGGTANGGVDTLTESLQIGVTAGANAAPVLSGTNNLGSVLEDSPGDAGTLVSALISGYVTDADSGALAGIAVTGVNSSNGAWQFSVDDGASWSAIAAPSATSALLLAADAQTRVRFVPSADFNGTVAAGLTFRAWDRTSGVAGATADTSTNGSATAFSAALASADVTVTAVNDAPVRTAGVVNNLTVLEDASATSLGLGTLAYGPGGGADEAGQTLTFTVTAVPASLLGTVVLADGTTAVSAGTTYTLGQLEGMKFKATADSNGGPLTFAWKVTDNGGTANGGVDTRSESLTISVTALNDAPLRTAGVVNNLTVLEDAATTSLGLGALNYAAGGGPDEATQLLTFTVTAVPASTLGSVVLADGTTVVAANTAYTLAQLQGMQFEAAADANGGPVTFAWKATDDGGTANGGVDTLAESLTISVTAVNDPPVNTVPGAQAASEDTPLVFSSANGNALSVADVDSAALSTTVSVSNGVVTAAGLCRGHHQRQRHWSGDRSAARPRPSTGR